MFLKLGGDMPNQDTTIYNTAWEIIAMIFSSPGTQRKYSKTS